MGARSTLLDALFSYRTARQLTVGGSVGLIHKFLLAGTVLGLGIYMRYTGAWSEVRVPMAHIALVNIGIAGGAHAMAEYYHATSGHPSLYPRDFRYCSNHSYTLNVPHMNLRYDSPHCELLDPASAVVTAGDGSAFVATTLMDYIVVGFPCSNESAAAHCVAAGHKLQPAQGPQCECVRQSARFVVAAEKMPIAFQFQYNVHDHLGPFGGVYPASAGHRRIEASWVHKNGTILNTYPGAVPPGIPVTASTMEKYAKFAFTFEQILAMADVRLDDRNPGGARRQGEHQMVGEHARFRHTGVRAVVEIELNNRNSEDLSQVSRAVKAEVRTQTLEDISRMVAGPIEHTYVGGEDVHGVGNAATSPETWRGYDGREYVRVNRVKYGIWIEFHVVGVVNVFSWAVFGSTIVVYLTATLGMVTLLCDLYVYRTMPFVRREKNTITSNEIGRAHLAATLFATSSQSKLARPGPRGGPDDHYEQLKVMCDSLAGVQGMTPKAAFAISHAIVAREEALEQQAKEAGYGKGTHTSPVQAPLFLELARCLVCSTDAINDRVNALVDGACEHSTSEEYLRFRREFEQARDQQLEAAREKVAADGRAAGPNGACAARNGTGSRAPRSKVSQRRSSDRQKSQQGEGSETRSASYFMAALNSGANAACRARQPATLSETRDAPCCSQTSSLQQVQRRRDYALTYAP